MRLDTDIVLHVTDDSGCILLAGYTDMGWWTQQRFEREGTTMRIAMPIHEFVEGVFYNITVTNGLVVIISDVISSAVEFNTLPTITSISACVPKLKPEQYQAYCLVNDSMSISVLNFDGISDPLRMLIAWGDDRVECAKALMTSSRSVRCTVPAHSQISSNLHRVEFQKSYKCSTRLWDNPDTPRIVSLTGPSCYSNAHDTVPRSWCQPGQSNILTITGDRVNASGSITIHDSIPCTSLVIIDDQTVTCVLCHQSVETINLCMTLHTALWLPTRLTKHSQLAALLM